MLLAGLLVYWLYRPGIYLFDFLGIGNAAPLLASGAFDMLLRNHFADAAWCAAAFAFASFLRDNHYPRLYFHALLALPFLSELSQAARLVPGTFDWLDLLLYAVLLGSFLIWERKNMNTGKKHIVGISLVALMAAGVIGSGGPTIEWEYGTFFGSTKADESFEKPSLAVALHAATNPAVVLRVPAPATAVTQEKQAETQRLNSVLYNTIDKELAKAGFVVRDRALFGKVLDQQNLDYKRIGQLTETDIIIELIDYNARKHFKVERYRDDKGYDKEPPVPLYFVGPAIEFKIISVKENDLVASYTFYFTPNCKNGCKDRFARTSANTWEIISPRPDPDEVFNEFAARLIKKLKRR